MIKEAPAQALRLKTSMKILHLSPSFFSASSVVGGGERYAFELAKACSRRAETVFLTLADRAGREKQGNLSVEYINRKNPLSFFQIAKAIAAADVIHCYQVRHFCTDLALCLGKTLGKRVFITDIGGGQRFALSYHLPLLRKADALLLLSEYSKKLWQEIPAQKRPSRLEVIYGGVDMEKFRPAEVPKTSRILFVGCLLPHKGIDYLIEALDENMELDVVGTVYDVPYFEILKKKSQGKKVSFCQGLNDAELIRKYQEAAMTVQCSVYETSRGEKTLVPELLGLAALESMSCATPVIVTDVASLPEIVVNAKTGFIVRPNDSAVLRRKIREFLDHPSDALEMGRKAREFVLPRFTWDKVAERCLEIYGGERNSF